MHEPVHERFTERTQALMRQRWARDDRGISLPELLVVMVVMGVLAGIVTGIVMWSQRTTTSQARNGELWADMQDASTQLLRDVNDASTITLAEANRLTVEVVRDDKCQERDWVVDTTNKRLTVTTRFYEQLDCTGPTTTREDRIIGDNAVGTNAAGSEPTLFTSAATFSYYDTLSSAALPFPVEPDRISRVEWSLAAQADTNMRVETLKSGAAFASRGLTSTGGGEQQNSTSPLLCLSLRTPVDAACGTVPPAATGKFEGVDKPVLQWVDTSPTLTLGWTVWRVANPEGMAQNDPARTSWTAVYYSATPATTSWTDTTLPAGYTAQYVVRASTASGVGPTSNQVVTGLRPAAPTVTAAGAQQSIGVTWTASVGATGYDVYRDGKLLASLGAVTSFTDQPGQPGWAGTGYGHSHYYRVVPVNRWENRLTRGGEALRLPIDTDVTATYTGGARLVSAQTPASGAFTAPPAPALSVAASAGRDNVVDWAAAAWVGSGPTTGRETGWQVWYRSSTEAGAQVSGSPMAASTTTWTHTSRPAGRYSEYAVRGVNASGSGALAGYDREWQRPATPACSIVAATTRSLTVGANAIAATPDEGYSNYEVRLNVGGWSANGTTFDPLSDNAGYGFNVHVQGAGSGLWSDEGSCAGTTPDLEAAPAYTPACSVSRSSAYAPATLTASSAGGSGTRQVRMAGGTWYTNSATYSNRSAGYYGFEARSFTDASDGWNSDTNWSGTDTCGTTIDPPPTPGPFTASSCGLGAQWALGPAGSGGSGFAGIQSLRVCPGVSANATSYEASWTWKDKNDVRWTGGSGRSVSPGQWTSLTSCFYPAGTTATAPSITITAQNAYGSVSDTYGASPGAPAMSCY